ncbi:MAG: LexA family transcriptional regulator [Chitinophagaceae bacterium]|nr:LexA family transcriptional regulator [Chitinophagaceae bacterium]
MAINEQIKELRVSTGKTQEYVASALGIKRSTYATYETGRVDVDIELLQKIADLYQVPLSHFIPGSGIGKGIAIAPIGRFPKKIEQGKAIPFYDIDFAAGDIEFYNGNSTIQAAYTMDIPEFSGCTAFRTYGESMEKLIKSGDILFGTRVNDWESHLEYGQIYGIICIDKRRYLKFIRKANGKEDTHFLLKSENQAFDDFLLPKSKIKSIWLIHGWMNKRT